MDYRQFADHVKQRQRLRWQKMTKPDDEWWPEIHFDTHTDGVHREAIPPYWFADRESKYTLFQTLAAFTRHAQPSKVALVVTMFMLRADHPMGRVIAQRMEDEPDRSPTEGLPYFQDVEGTIETLWVHVFDAERHEGWHATITRLERGRPQLGPFQQAGPDELAGDMIDPIKEALR